MIAINKLKQTITQDQLKELLYYNPETGEFTWIKARSNRIPVGKIAGFNLGRYRAIEINGQSYLVHRLAWLYTTGSWPVDQIDHKDGDRGNNKFSNLRQATHSQNSMNCKKYANNSTGVKGVRWSKRSNQYIATIMVRNKSIHLGCYHSISLAKIAYQSASSFYHRDFGRIV